MAVVQCGNESFYRSFRLVCKPKQIPLVEKLLESEGFRFEPEPFSPFCRKLTAEPFPLGASLAGSFGYIYIQDRSSMLPPLALNPGSSTLVLDMCASPGSKTGFLAQLAGEESLILANEPNPPRLATLRANMELANFFHVATCQYAGENIPLLPDSIPYILLDPPCSGWGTVLKHPKTIKIWQGAKIGRLVSIQKNLLKKAAQLLMPGGFLLYSTCTTNYEENEAQTAFAENVLSLQRISLNPFPGFIYEERKGGEGTLLVKGKESRAQGFYLSLLRKPGEKSLDSTGGNMNYSLPVLPKSCLKSELCDLELLPEGMIGIFNNKLYFLSDKALILPTDFIWRGAKLGMARNFLDEWQFAPDAGLRNIIRKDAPKIVLEDCQSLRSLLNGQALASELKQASASLWWRDLPLGIIKLKQGRIISRFK